LKREPYRTKTLTIFRYFNVKKLILMEFLEKRKPYREAFLFEKALKTDIYAVRFALTALFSFKNEIFNSTLPAFYKNAQIFTTARANAFLRIDLFENNRGTVRAFE
jgi:hypothetical protein